MTRRTHPSNYKNNLNLVTVGNKEVYKKNRKVNRRERPHKEYTYNHMYYREVSKTSRQIRREKEIRKEK